MGSLSHTYHAISISTCIQIVKILMSLKKSLSYAESSIHFLFNSISAKHLDRSAFRHLRFRAKHLDPSIGQLFTFEFFFSRLRMFKWRNKTPAWMQIARSVCSRGIFRCMTSKVCFRSNLRNQLESWQFDAVKMAASMKCVQKLSATLPFWQLFGKTELRMTARNRCGWKRWYISKLLNIRNWNIRRWDH